MQGWTARKIIQVICCGNLVLKAPFPNVHTIQIYWEFRVEPNEIVSVGPSSYASEDENILNNEFICNIFSRGLYK
ncbi:unnamed protein product [Adineta steineri]|uniref:Uncharacterized protein n=1 Tax=Adineta steineri TaxID=433720 RepID=A0A813Y9W3_9BILA|nr:unnamed protein product [Adineta steineri]CAF3542321.1 unnamed protein product [Adineta steineri]